MAPRQQLGWEMGCGWDRLAGLLASDRIDHFGFPADSECTEDGGSP
jgi:hypothetical protein